MVVLGGWTCPPLILSSPLCTLLCYIHLKRLSINAVSDVAELLERGQSARKSGETLMNSESSRSHSVFTAEVSMRSRDDSGITTVRSSRLNLVDLAGASLPKLGFSQPGRCLSLQSGHKLRSAYQ